MKILNIVLLSAFVFCGTSFAQEKEAEQVDASDRYASLEKDKSGFRETWVAPNADFSRFDKLHIWKAEFQYRDVGPARRSRSTMMSTRKTEFGISEDDRKEFEKIVREAFLEEVQKARNFTLVDTFDANTLIMRGGVLDIISRVPPETVGRSEIYLSSIGEATLIMELIDAGTGEVLAVVAERRHLQRSGSREISTMPTNRVTIISDIRGWSSRAAKILRTELDKAMAGK